jgi:hypothetical protein
MSSDTNGTRTRFESVVSSGFYSWGLPPVSKSAKYVHTRQTTRSTDTLWPYLQYELQQKPHLQNKAWIKWAKNQDWGAGFATEKNTIESNLTSLLVDGTYASSPYRVGASGPAFLAGFNSANPFRTAQAVSDETQLMFGLGGSAINAVRPNKPIMDLASTIGELRSLGGIPKMMGSMITRASSLRDLFRESGNEYLNAQFGWGPLQRDIQNLAEYALYTRQLVFQYAQNVGRPIRRRYQFDDVIDTTEGLSKPISSSAYELDAPGPYGGLSFLSTRASVVTPVEITRTVTKSYFTGAFRIYSSELQWLDTYLAGIENEANTLLGTRLDPEVLWNLQPWTWLADYFVNFGDVLANISAGSDGVVMKYGYLMREQEIRKEIHFPRGVWRRTGTSSWVPCSNPFTVTLTSHSKTRVKASPFGFGLNPESFTEGQWAILLALGLSKGLK